MFLGFSFSFIAEDSFGIRGLLTDSLTFFDSVLKSTDNKNIELQPVLKVL